MKIVNNIITYSIAALENRNLHDHLDHLETHLCEVQLDLQYKPP